MEFDPVVLPVPGRDDLVRFEADIGFVRDSKAVVADEYEKYKEHLSEGDLLIAGWGANFEIDRENEAFADGAFERGLKSFLAGEATLAYHHKHDIALGRVLDATPVEGKGVRVVARVDNQPESSPHRVLYEQVKKGTLNALSCGGFFRRKMTEAGQRVVDVDLTEWSITPVPVGRGCNFSVVAGKALMDDVKIPDKPEIDGELREDDVRSINYLLEELGNIFTRLEDSVGKRKKGDA